MRTFIFISSAIALLALPQVQADESSVDEMLDASRQQYVAGDTAGAAAGFDAVLKSEPNNPIANYYRIKLAELEQRDAEETAMDQVQNAWGGMLLRDYPVSAAARRRLGLDGTDEDEPVDLSDGFPEVSFPEGTYVVYRPQLNRIFALNTPAEIKRLEALMASLDASIADSQQVEIEARFVEFAEGTLEELGFEWSDPVDGASMGSVGDWSVRDGEDLFASALRTGVFEQPQSLGLGEISGNAGRIEDSFDTTAGTLSLSGGADSTDIDLMIRALDQTSGVDVLSAPRVVTVSGKEAVIQVGQRHYYPDVYEEGVSQGTVLHVRYEDFAEKLLGVELKVTPTIKGDEISLKLNPKIIDLVGWQQFELAPADTSYTYYQYRIGQQFEHDAVRAKLPIFKERQVKTEEVVQDGATVGMGGLISEKLEAFEDRVPVLGSIPLIGRLFRSEGERSVKRNLMIMVSASKVQPNGTINSVRSFK